MSDNRLSNEACVEQIGNRFDLVLVAAIRAKELASGHRALTNKPGKNFGTTALQEIAEGRVGRDYLQKLRK
jgi:DNA-directed RNA polymerase subunit omega